MIYIGSEQSHEEVTKWIREMRFRMVYGQGMTFLLISFVSFASWAHFQQACDEC